MTVCNVKDAAHSDKSSKCFHSPCCRLQQVLASGKKQCTLSVQHQTAERLVTSSKRQWVLWMWWIETFYDPNVSNYNVKTWQKYVGGYLWWFTRELPPKSAPHGLFYKGFQSAFFFNRLLPYCVGSLSPFHLQDTPVFIYDKPTARCCSAANSRQTGLATRWGTQWRI